MWILLERLSGVRDILEVWEMMVLTVAALGEDMTRLKKVVVVNEGESEVSGP
jgi:hypothetical protein